jgi:hypothetical protein
VKANLKLFKYINPDKTSEYSLQVETEHEKFGMTGGSVAWVDKLSWKQAIGLLMSGVPCEEVKVKGEEEEKK